MGSKKLSKRAEIFPGLLLLQVVFNSEIKEIKERREQENQALQEIEYRKTQEIERGQRKLLWSHELTKEANNKTNMLDIEKEMHLKEEQWLRKKERNGILFQNSIKTLSLQGSSIAASSLYTLKF